MISTQFNFDLWIFILVSILFIVIHLLFAFIVAFINAREKQIAKEKIEIKNLNEELLNLIVKIDQKLKKRNLTFQFRKDKDGLERIKKVARKTAPSIREKFANNETMMEKINAALDSATRDNKTPKQVFYGTTALSLSEDSDLSELTKMLISYFEEHYPDERRDLVLIDFEMDDENDTQNGGPGNWTFVFVPEILIDDDLSDLVSDVTGFCVKEIKYCSEGESCELEEFFPIGKL